MMRPRRPLPRAFLFVAYRAVLAVLLVGALYGQLVHVSTITQGGDSTSPTDRDVGTAASRLLLSGGHPKGPTAVLCHPTLLNASGADPVRVLHWANYHVALGFRQVFLWWSVPDVSDEGEAQPWVSTLSPASRRAWETLRAVPHVQLTVVPEAVAAALGTDRFDVRCLRESARSDDWAALVTSDQFLWLSSGDSFSSSGTSATPLDQFLARHHDQATTSRASTLEFTRRSYSSLFRDGTNASLFGGINQYSYERRVECSERARPCPVGTSGATLRRVGGTPTVQVRRVGQAGQADPEDHRSSVGSVRLDPFEAHVKEWPGYSTGGGGVKVSGTTIGSNQSIPHVRDSSLHTWFESVDSSFRRRRSESRTTHLDQPIIYFVVTASLQLSPDQEGAIDPMVRQKQYVRGIESLLRATDPGFPLRHKVIVVENNGRRPTILDEVDGVSVLYTDNNLSVDYPWKGSKELLDVLACIEHFGMRDHDLVVKMTGRYYVDEGSHFFGLLRNMDWTRTQALIKFGPYLAPANVPQNDCVTGLIMVPVAAVRRIDRANPIVEHSWAEAARTVLPPSAVHAIQGAMGIYIAPGGAVDYFLV